MLGVRPHPTSKDSASVGLGWRPVFVFSKLPRRFYCEARNTEFGCFRMVVLNQGWYTCSEYLAMSREVFWLSQLEEGRSVLPESGRLRPRMLLNVLQCTGQPLATCPAARPPPQQKIIWPKMSIVPTLRNPVWEVLSNSKIPMCSPNPLLWAPIVIFFQNLDLILCFVCVSCSVLSDSVRPHGLWPVRLLCPWDFPDKNTKVGSHSLLQDLVLYNCLKPFTTHPL